MDSKELVKIAVKALEDKKAHNIKILDIKEISSVGDYFVVADGSNRNQVQAMCDNVEEYMSKEGINIKNREGYSIGGWILLDYYDIIIHIFVEEERSFYGIEHIWSDANSVFLEDL